MAAPASNGRDFTILDDPVRLSDVRAYARRLRWTRRPPVVLSLLVVCLVAVVAMTRVLQPGVGIVAIVGGCGTVVVIAAITASWATAIGRRVRLERFARVNGLDYADELRNDARRGLGFPPGIENQGTATIIGPGASDGYGFILGVNRPRPDPRASRMEMRRPFLFLQLALPRSVPHLILRNRRSRIVPLFTGRTAAETTLRLDGDYHNAFTLIAPASYERDALEIFTPNLIAALLEFADAAEFELVDRTAFLYLPARTPVWTAEVMRAVLELADDLNRMLDRQTGRYIDERSADGAPDAARARRIRSAAPITGGGILWTLAVIAAAAAILFVPEVAGMLLR